VNPLRFGVWKPVLVVVVLIAVGVLLTACDAPYKTQQDVIDKACAVVEDKFPGHKCAADILVKYQKFEGRYYGYALGSNAVLLDERCKDANWSRASNCVHILAHEVAHTAGLKSEHHAEFVANRVWMLR